MHIHGPDLLQGPVSRHRDWWDSTEFDSIEAMLNTPQRRESTALKEAKTKRPKPDAPIRTELVQRIKKEIADGTYDTPEKWEAALDRMIGDLE